MKAQDANWILSLFFSQPFPFYEIMHFQSSSLCFYNAFSAFRNPENGSSTTTHALYTENE
jgi:hypothetical protein